MKGWLSINVYDLRVPILAILLPLLKCSSAIKAQPTPSQIPESGWPPPFPFLVSLHLMPQSCFTSGKLLPLPVLCSFPVWPGLAYNIRSPDSPAWSSLPFVPAPSGLPSTFSAVTRHSMRQKFRSPTRTPTA